MPHICPRPCSRLATAAVFISVGVVQFVVGIILLRSKYVYLLAGPDFWTSSCNIAVGCLLGLSASIWKRSRRVKSKKHAIRRNLLLSLLSSSLLLNVTTLGIFLLGEGNTLLSIRLENNGKYSDSTFAGEVLAYAYVTSVCCPIVCIVMSIVSMAGTCFKHASRKSDNANTPLKKLEEERSRSLRWIYSPELLDLSKRKIREYMLSSSGESSSGDELEVPVHQKYVHSAEDLQHVLNRMALGKRDSLLSDSAIMLQQMERRRKGKKHSLNSDGTYVGPILSRSRQAAAGEKRVDLEDDSAWYNEPAPKRSRKQSREYADMNGNIQMPLDVALKRMKKSKKLGTLYSNPYRSEELLSEYEKVASNLTKHYPSQYRKYREQVQSGSRVTAPKLSVTSDITDYGSKNAASVAYKKKITMSESEPATKSTEYLRIKPDHESSRRLLEEIEDYQRDETAEETSPGPSDCFSPNGSEFEAISDSTFDLSRSSFLAGEVIPINVRSSTVARLSGKLIAVPSPVVPPIQQKQVKAPKTSVDSGTGTLNENDSFPEVPNENDLKEKISSGPSLRADSKFGNRENTQQYPKMTSQSTKKFDLNRISTMASISEEPSSEPNQSEESLSQSAVLLKIASRSRKRSPSVHPETPKQDDDCSDRDMTPKRKGATSGKSLRKKWSLALPENQSDLLDQVVDEDSLIGLTEEELIARQDRTRSIRKAVQQRIREDITVNV